MTEYEIWIGNYDLGHGYDPPTKPEMVGRESASGFTLACLKFELKRKLKSIERRDAKGEYIDHQTFITGETIVIVGLVSIMNQRQKRPRRLSN
jgi:hypothetical protein